MKPSCPTEHEEQAAVIRWRDAVAVLRWPELLMPDGRFPLWSNNNGTPIGFSRGKRDDTTAYQIAAKLKAEGTVKGVPDLFLAVSGTEVVDESKLYRRVLHGLWIEMKRRKGGRISPAQAAVHEYLERAGYRVAVARGSDEAIAAVEEYLK